MPRSTDRVLILLAGLLFAIGGCCQLFPFLCPMKSDPLQVSAGPDFSVMQGVAAQINAAVSGGDGSYTIQWSPASGLDNPGMLRPQATPATTTTYKLTVTDGHGAVASDDVVVTVTTPPDTVASLCGSVVDAASKMPLAGVLVRIDRSPAAPLTALTNADGRYLLPVPALPDFFAVSASASGYIPATKGLSANQIGAGRPCTDFELEAGRPDTIVIEIVPDVHHLGDDNFGGQINSQFQKNAEGKTFTAKFDVAANQLPPTYNTARIRMLHKGAEHAENSARLNDSPTSVSLSASSADGSFGAVELAASISDLRPGQNTLTVSSSPNSFGDFDDFEFVNVQIRLSFVPPPDNGRPDITNTANSITSAAGGTRTDPEGAAAPASVNLVTWKDSRGADRTVTLGGHLYQYDFSFDDNRQVVQRSANDNAYGHPGFGYVVSHNNQNGNSPFGKQNTPTTVKTTVLTGGHHAIHRVEMLYDRDKEGGGNGIKIPVVIEWLVATGRDHPVWSVTWKAGEISNPSNINLDAYRMDVRGPYGSLNFDGAANPGAGDAIGGVAWGDYAFKFRTTDAQLTLNSPWTYNTANTVAFTQAWTANTNAEMGIVQTRRADREMGFPDRVGGRERGATSATAFLNKGDCTLWGADARNYLVPCVNGWPYQLMNYDWDPGVNKPANEPTGTKLVAWGTPYGWLGASSFAAFDGGTGDGRGDRAYATFIVLGPKARYNAATGMYDKDGEVAGAVREVEALTAATLTDVTAGTVATQAPKGPGASQSKSLVNGYDDTYAVYNLIAADNTVAFNMTPAAGKPVRNPIFVVRNYSGIKLPRISVAGADLTINGGNASSGAFVSVNPGTMELWVTLNQTLSSATTVRIGP